MNYKPITSFTPSRLVFRYLLSDGENEIIAYFDGTAGNFKRYSDNSVILPTEMRIEYYFEIPLPPNRLVKLRTASSIGY